MREATIKLLQLAHDRRTGRSTEVAVQQLRTAIWVPEEYALIGTPKNFTVETRTVLRDLMFARHQQPTGTQDLDAWIGADSGGVFEFPIEGRRYQYSSLGSRDVIKGIGWWHLPFYTWIVSGAIVAIALVLRGTSWENKLGLLIIVAFIACTYALRDRRSGDSRSGRLVRTGLALVLIAVWLVHALLNCRPAWAVAASTGHGSSSTPFSSSGTSGSGTSTTGNIRPGPIPTGSVDPGLPPAPPPAMPTPGEPGHAPHA